MTWTFPLSSHTPTDPCISDSCYLPVSPLPLHVPYFPKLPPDLYISSTLLEAAGPSPISGIGHCLPCDTPELSSGLSSKQMVGFSLVHSLLGFLGCERWVRLN